MTPTPKQIMREALEDLANGVQHREVMVSKAKAALTTAAGVDAEFIKQERAMGFREGAEFAKEHFNEAATIERCAQVAESLKISKEGFATRPPTQEELVAAIRALKEET